MVQNYTTSTAGQVDLRLGNRVYFSKLGDPMAYDNTLLCEGSSETPVQRELRSLKYEIKNGQNQLRNLQECLRISKAKLAAVKKLVK